MKMIGSVLLAVLAITMSAGAAEKVTEAPDKATEGPEKVTVTVLAIEVNATKESIDPKLKDLVDGTTEATRGVPFTSVRLLWQRSQTGSYGQEFTVRFPAQMEVAVLPVEGRAGVVKVRYRLLGAGKASVGKGKTIWDSGLTVGTEFRVRGAWDTDIRMGTGFLIRISVLAKGERTSPVRESVLAKGQLVAVVFVESQATALEPAQAAPAAGKGDWWSKLRLGMTDVEVEKLGGKPDGSSPPVPEEIADAVNKKVYRYQVGSQIRQVYFQLDEVQSSHILWWTVSGWTGDGIH